VKTQKRSHPERSGGGKTGGAKSRDPVACEGPSLQKSFKIPSNLTARLNRQFDLAQFYFRVWFSPNFEITSNSVSNVIQGFRHRRALRVTSRKLQTTDRNSLAVFDQGDMKLSTHVRSLAISRPQYQRYSR
jgi:hypothetical protein